MDFDFEGVVNETIGMRELEGVKIHIQKEGHPYATT